MKALGCGELHPQKSEKYYNNILSNEQPKRKSEDRFLARDAEGVRGSPRKGRGGEGVKSIAGKRKNCYQFLIF